MHEFKGNVASLELKKQETFDVIRHHESKLSAVQGKMKWLQAQKEELEDARWKQTGEAAEYSDEIVWLEEQLAAKKSAFKNI